MASGVLQAVVAVFSLTSQIVRNYFGYHSCIAAQVDLIGLNAHTGAPSLRVAHISHGEVSSVLGDRQPREAIVAGIVVHGWQVQNSCYPKDPNEQFNQLEVSHHPKSQIIHWARSIWDMRLHVSRVRSLPISFSQLNLQLLLVSSLLCLIVLLLVLFLAIVVPKSSIPRKVTQRVELTNDDLCSVDLWKV